jgi:adenylate kinase family enzyme
MDASSERVLIVGNSGSGKSTLAARLAAAYGLAHLDLDGIVWEPGEVAVQRPLTVAAALLDDFAASHPAWVIEGCYGELVSRLLPRCTWLLFLDPGREACLGNNRRRPWEPHKYATPAAQDAMLEALQGWVAGYYARDDAWSLTAHAALFAGFAGRKRRLASVAEIAAFRLDGEAAPRA